MLFGGRGGAGRGSAGRGGRRPRAGADLEHPIEVTLAEAYRGTTRVLELQTPDGRTRRIEVTIPAGVDDGARVRVAGQGAPGRDGGPAGDLYLVVTVLPDARFRREGTDLRTTVTAPLPVLLLGGTVRVPTPDGRSLELTVPAGSQDGRVFRLRGQGLARPGGDGARGDLYAEVHVRLPEHLTPRARRLVEELASLDEMRAA